MSLKWTGSKSWLTPAFREIHESFELFAGSAAISLARANTCHLNDLCEPLILAYSELTTRKGSYILDVQAVFNQIQCAPAPKAEFYAIRQRFNQTGQNDPVLFLAILYSGFNGLWRTGPHGCNVPYGGPRKFPLSDLVNFPDHKIVSLTMKMWQDVAPPNSKCVVYADPPYATAFTGYTHKGWRHQDNVELVDYLSSLDNPVILSMLRTDDNEKLLKTAGFDFVTLGKVYTNGAKSSIKKKEILGFNEQGRSIIRFSECRTS